MTITSDSVPAALKTDRDIAPYIARAVELAEVNPVVSYYCKIYVLEHILSHKVHQSGDDAQRFTVELLDDTESIKASHADESVRQVLHSKQLSINLVFVFAFKLFNSCLEDLSSYDGVSKVRLASKLRATINFWSLFSVFESEVDAIDYSKTTGGACSTSEEFFAFVKDKLKTLKYQLSRLLKDQVPIKGEESILQELEEFEKLTGCEDGEEQNDTQPNPEQDRINHLAGELESSKLDSPPPGVSPDSSSAIEAINRPPVLDEGGETHHLPSTPQKHPSLGPEDDEDGLTLPGAPNFDPSSDSEPGLQLPGAPKFLPDDDISQVNKNSSIQVFHPEKTESSKSVPRNKPPVHRSTSPGVAHITKESLSSIVDTTEQIGKIQKHAKFAISALNYEDLDTAEAELLKGLEMLREVKKMSI